MPVVVTSDFPPNRGGIERYMSSLATALRAWGDVVVVAPREPGCDALDAASPYRVIRYRKTRSRALRFLEIFRIAVAAFRALRLVPDRQVIASSWIRSGIACAMLPRRARGPMAILAHGSEVISQRGFARLALMRWTFARADAVVANSAFTQRLLAERGVTTCAVVYCGTGLQAVERSETRHPTVLSVCRLIRRKGIDRTIQALPAVVARVPDLRYEVVGAGPELPSLLQLVRRLRLENHVRFLGQVEEGELVRAYARASCFVLPARNAGGDVEGFGIVYLEAAIAGVPAIGGRGCGAEEAIEDGKTGILVDGDYPEQIAAAILQIIENPVQASAMGRYAQARARRLFTWERVASRIMNSLSPASPTAPIDAVRAESLATNSRAPLG